MSIMSRRPNGCLFGERRLFSCVEFLPCFSVLIDRFLNCDANILQEIRDFISGNVVPKLSRFVTNQSNPKNDEFQADRADRRK